MAMARTLTPEQKASRKAKRKLQAPTIPARQQLTTPQTETIRRTPLFSPSVQPNVSLITGEEAYVSPEGKMYIITQADRKNVILTEITAPTKQQTFTPSQQQFTYLVTPEGKTSKESLSQTPALALELTRTGMAGPGTRFITPQENREIEERERRIKRKASDPRIAAASVLPYAPEYFNVALGAAVTGKFTNKKGREEALLESSEILKEYVREIEKRTPIEAGMFAAKKTGIWVSSYVAIPYLFRYSPTLLKAGFGLVQTISTKKALEEPTLGNIGQASFLPLVVGAGYAGGRAFGFLRSARITSEQFELGKVTPHSPTHGEITSIIGTRIAGKEYPSFGKSFYITESGKGITKTASFGTRIIPKREPIIELAKGAGIERFGFTLEKTASMSISPRRIRFATERLVPTSIRRKFNVLLEGRKYKPLSFPRLPRKITTGYEKMARKIRFKSDQMGGAFISKEIPREQLTRIFGENVDSEARFFSTKGIMSKKKIIGGFKEIGGYKGLFKLEKTRPPEIMMGNLGQLKTFTEFKPPVKPTAAANEALKIARRSYRKEIIPAIPKTMSFSMVGKAGFNTKESQDFINSKINTKPETILVGKTLSPRRYLGSSITQMTRENQLLKQKSLQPTKERLREMNILAPKMDQLQIQAPQMGEISLMKSGQLQRQRRELMTDEIVRQTGFNIMPISRLTYPPPINSLIWPSKGKARRAKKKKTAKTRQPHKYRPSILGIEMKKFIKQAPEKALLTGIEIRPRIKRRRK